MEEKPNTVRMREVRQERREKGLCHRCGRPSVPEMTRCHKCGIDHRIRERKRRGNKPHKESGMGRIPVYQGE